MLKKPALRVNIDNMNTSGNSSTIENEKPLRRHDVTYYRRIGTNELKIGWEIGRM